MAREPYKPLWNSSGIYTCAKTELPATGKDDGTLYFTTDTHELFYWNETSKQYTTVSGVGTKEIVFQDKSSFPVPGIEGTVYFEKSTGKKYVWLPNSGSSWVRIGNLMYLERQPSQPMSPDSIWGCTKPSTQGWNGPFYRGTNTEAHQQIAVSFIYQYHDRAMDVMKPPEGTYAAGSVVVQLPQSQYAYYEPINLNLVLAGGCNFAWVAVDGGYVPIG